MFAQAHTHTQTKDKDSLTHTHTHSLSITLSLTHTLTNTYVGVWLAPYRRTVNMGLDDYGDADSSRNGSDDGADPDDEVCRVCEWIHTYTNTIHTCVGMCVVAGVGACICVCVYVCACVCVSVWRL